MKQPFGPGGPFAEVILDSVSELGHRITTMEVKFHRFILAEMNTHRVFSRNSASSRAIPVHKIISNLKNDPAYPVYWGKEQKGMQTGDKFDASQVSLLKQQWEDAAYYAIRRAQYLIQEGLHKSLVNRLLEPFMWHTAIITSTEWDNFFNQRCSPAAQPEMKAIADQMQLAYFKSVPAPVQFGEWHLPYVYEEDWDELNNIDPNNQSPTSLLELMQKVSVARCARVSYLTHDGTRAITADLELHDRLEESGHWSPFEHVATPASGAEYVLDGEGPNVNLYRRTGNFTGWEQLRKSHPEENQTQFIPNLDDLAHIKMKMEALLEF